jgi:hypothetical protein
MACGKQEPFSGAVVVVVAYDRTVFNVYSNLQWSVGGTRFRICIQVLVAGSCKSKVQSLMSSVDRVVNLNTITGDDRMLRLDLDDLVFNAEGFLTVQ